MRDSISLIKTSRSSDVFDNLKKKNGVLITNSDNEHSNAFIKRNKKRASLGFSLKDVQINSTSPISFIFKEKAYTKNVRVYLGLV